MKYFVCSDIHGSASNAKKILDAFDRENADMIIFLGDILYHGPRNDLPEEYAPKKVIELLKPYSDKIIACRGNCDGEVEEMVLDFPVLSSYNLIVDSGIKIFATHGHIYSPLKETFSSDDLNTETKNDSTDNTVVKGSKLPPLKSGIILYGHTHISKLYKIQTKIANDKMEEIIVMNPGSPSIPKENTLPGYGIIEINDKISPKIKSRLLTLDGTIIKEL